MPLGSGNRRQNLHTLCKPTAHFSDHMDTLQIIMTLFRSIRYLTDHLDTFQIMLVLLRLSGNFSYHPHPFFISSVHFVDHSVTFRPSGHFPDYLDSFQTFRRFSLSSEVFLTLQIWGMLLKFYDLLGIVWDFISRI